MYLRLSLKIKAAFFCAAFLFISQASANIEGIKKDVSELLIQKKKSSAIQLISNQIKQESHPTKKNELLNLQLSVARIFVARDTQELYESSINLTFESPKESLKIIENCLSADPQQIDCLIQKLRLQSRQKNIKETEKISREIKNLLPGSRLDVFSELVSTKEKPEFKSKQIIKSIPDKADEEVFALLTMEIERAFLVKNYSRAKDCIHYFEKHYPDWPDILFYKSKISEESSEVKSKIETESDEMMIYQNKCKSITKTVSRKYRYDIDLCNRSNK